MDVGYLDPMPDTPTTRAVYRRAAEHHEQTGEMQVGVTPVEYRALLGEADAVQIWRERHGIAGPNLGPASHLFGYNVVVEPEPR